MQHLSWCYVSTATPAFDPARLDDLYAQGVNNDTAHQLCQRIHDVFYAMRDEVHASK